MKNGDLFDDDASKKAKEAALDSVRENAGRWFDLARAEAHRSLPPFVMTGEGIRQYLTVLVGEPHHHNAWGALISTLVKDGLIVPTGRWLPMTQRSSHARRTPEYQPGGKR